MTIDKKKQLDFVFHLVFYSQNQNNYNNPKKEKYKKPMKRQINIKTRGLWKAQQLNQSRKKKGKTKPSPFPRVLRRKDGIDWVKHRRHILQITAERFKLEPGALHSPETYLIGARERFDDQIKDDWGLHRDNPCHQTRKQTNLKHQRATNPHN